MAGDDVVIFFGFSKEFISSIWNEVHKLDEYFDKMVDYIGNIQPYHNCGKPNCSIKFTRISVTPFLNKHYITFDFLFYGSVCGKEFSITIKRFNLPKKGVDKLKSISDVPFKLFYTPDSLLKKLKKK